MLPELHSVAQSGCPESPGPPCVTPGDSVCVRWCVRSVETTLETEDAEGGCLRTLKDLAPGESTGNLLWAWKSSPSQNPRTTAGGPNVAAGWVQSPRVEAPS